MLAAPGLIALSVGLALAAEDTKLGALDEVAEVQDALRLVGRGAEHLDDCLRGEVLFAEEELVRMAEAFDVLIGPLAA